MGYREMYFELFRRQTDVINTLGSVIETLEELVNELKLGHLTTEEMVTGAKDGAEREGEE